MKVHITSIVVYARPEALSKVTSTIDDLPEAEVHATSPEGKCVATLETPTLYQVTETIDEIKRLPGVVDALLVYHHIEAADQLEQIVDLDAAPAEPNAEVTP